MARPLRLEFAGALYHLTACANARADIFADDEDRRLFLELLGKEISQQRWRCYAYCLMDNHFHLLIETPEPNLVAGMRRLNGVYTQSFNRRHGRVGHVFQGRYKSIVVDKDSYGLELSRYVVLNPVRARRVKHPQNWPWSSYRATVGRVAAPSWLNADWVLSQLGGRHPAAAYERFVRQGIGEHSPWEKLRGQIWLGSEACVERMEQLAEGKPAVSYHRLETMSSSSMGKRRSFAPGCVHYKAPYSSTVKGRGRWALYRCCQSRRESFRSSGSSLSRYCSSLLLSAAMSALNCGSNEKYKCNIKPEANDRAIQQHRCRCVRSGDLFRDQAEISEIFSGCPTFSYIL